MTASIGLDYASTSLGFRNSGALSPGRLMLWDTAEGELVDLERGIPMAVGSTTTPTDMQARDVNGVTIAAAGGDIGRAANGQIRAAVSRDLEIIVREVATRTALSQAYVARRNEDADPERAWRVADATGDPARYHYVLLVDPVRASSEQVRFVTETGGSVGVNIVNTAQGDISVRVPTDTQASCAQSSGDRPICFINAEVLKVFLNANRNLDYEPVGYSRAALSDALRRK